MPRRSRVELEGRKRWRVRPPTQRRGEDALQHKLNAIADTMADLMTELAGDERAKLRKDVQEPRQAVGLEDKESA